MDVQLLALFTCCVAVMITCFGGAQAAADLITTFTSSGVSADSATLNWDINTGRLAQDAGLTYLVLVRETGQTDCQQRVTKANTYTLTGLRDNTEYTAWVLPHCTAGWGMQMIPGQTTTPRYKDTGRVPCEQPAGCYSRSPAVTFRTRFNPTLHR